MKKLIVIINIFFVFACSPKQTDKAAEEATKSNENTVSLNEEQAKLAGLRLATVSQQSLTGIIEVNGKIDVPPQNLYSLSLPLGGYLKSTQLLPGMHFNKGEVIAYIEDPKFIELQQNYLSAKSRIELLKAEYERQKELNISKAASDKALQQAKAAYEAETIYLKSIEEQLRLIGIQAKKLTVENISATIPLYAPIDGFVGKVNVNIGKYVSATEVLFELVNPEDIHLNLRVYEKDINSLEIGQEVVAYTNTHPNKKYNCEIILIGKEVMENHSLEVHCHFESYDKKLVPGTFMNAQIKVKKNKVLAVPEEAVQQWEGKEVVFVKVGKAYEMVEVQTGVADNGFTEIVSSQQELNGKEVVAKGAYNLLMKLKNAAEE